MPLTLSDEVLQQVGLTEQEARVEFACHLFDAGKLALWPGAQLAGMTRVEFEAELMNRKIPIYRFTLDDLMSEQAALDKLGI